MRRRWANTTNPFHSHLPEGGQRAVSVSDGERQSVAYAYGSLRPCRLGGEGGRGKRPTVSLCMFNLGSIAVEQGRLDEGVKVLQRSLALSQPEHSIVRKLYALLSQCHRLRGEMPLALAACRKGREFYPDDVELLFQEGIDLRQRGERTGARECWTRLLQPRRGEHFASIDTGLGGYKTRHNLADLELEEGNLQVAEAHWRAARAQQPDFLPALVGLGEVYLRQGRPGELEQTVSALAAADHAVEADVLQARRHMMRKEFAHSYRLLEEALAQQPQSPEVLRVLSHALLQEGKDWPAAERALRALVALAPEDQEARHNLAVLQRLRRFAPRRAEEGRREQHDGPLSPPVPRAG